MGSWDWTPWAYQYGVGTVVLTIGIVAGWRNGTWSLRNPRWLAVVAGGWLAYAAVQGWLQWLGTHR